MYASCCLGTVNMGRGDKPHSRRKARLRSHPHKGIPNMTLSFFVVTLAQVLTLAIIVRAILSWFPASRTRAPVTAMLSDVTDPVLRPIQRRLPAFGGFDLSPLIAIVLISVLESVIL